MKEAKFKVNDHVYVKSDLHIECDVIDAMFSESTGWHYLLKDLDSQEFILPESDLERAKDYSMDIKIDIANNVVIATMYESVGGGAEAYPQGTWSSDPRGRDRHCPGCKLCLHATVQEYGRL